FEMFPDSVKNKSKIVVLSSSDNKRDIEKIVDNEYVIKFITKPLTDSTLNEVNALLAALN
ncbi:MAG: response regulator, partial [Thermonemataceae bacterium]|nr:response regulator [Thermonemataceae bacterium]